MKGRFILAIAAGAALLFSDAAEAQQAGALELGALGGFTVYDSEVGVESAPMVGGRLGIFVMPNVLLEGQWTYGEPDLTDQPGWQGREFISHELYQARLIYTHWMGESMGILLGAGYTQDNYSRVRNVAARGGGPSGLLGIRYRWTDLISFRLEGTAYHVPEDLEAHVAPRPQTLNLGIQAGASVTFRDREVETIVELPAPPPDTVMVTEEVEPPLPEASPTQICLSTGENVTVYVTPQGDTLVGERRVRVEELGPGMGFAGEYAGDRSWFIADEPITLTQTISNIEQDLEYVKSGGEVGLDCLNVVRVGEYDGIPLFADVGAEVPYETLYVPVTPGVWQPYQTDLAAVRG